jgi:hypothetical protein
MGDDATEEQQRPDEPPYFRYSATLRIFGTIPNFAEVKQNVGLNPTHIHRRGEFRWPGSKPYENDMWMYTPPVEETEPLHVHIDALWEAIRGQKQYLLSVKRDTTVDVFLSYRSNSDTAEVEVPYQSLRLFLELEVPFGLSIIIA